MIRVRDLGGRAVVDIDAAEKLGRIEKVILDPDARRVAGLVVSHAASTLGGAATQQTIPASAVHAVGPDAITVRHAALETPHAAPLDTLPRASELIGRKAVSTTGRFLGVVDDVLIDESDGRILGYELASSDPLARIGALFGERSQRPRYIRADAELRPGRELIVAPDDAVREWNTEETTAQTAARESAPHKTDDGGAATSARFRQSSAWFQRSGDEPAAWDNPQP